ncbi:MAG: hypothetical protein GEV06_16725 [Luteitalea sp.]|nr:hypothetical protein [Luteitalea sp.]
MIAEAQSRGLDWGQMRANAHKQAESLGAEIAACVVSPNTANDGRITQLAERAETFRAEYAAFVDLWFASADEQDREPAA